MNICNVCGSKIKENELSCPNCGYDISSLKANISAERKLMPLSTPLDEEKITKMSVISLIPIQEKTSSDIRIMPEITNDSIHENPESDLQFSARQENYKDNGISKYTNNLDLSDEAQQDNINDGDIYGHVPDDTLILTGDSAGYNNQNVYNVQFAGPANQEVYNVNHDGYYNYIEPVIEIESKDSYREKIFKFLLLVIGLLILFSLFFFMI